MKRKFTIDLYSDTNRISFPFKIEYNAPDIDELLYKIYCIVSTEIAKEITIQPKNNGWVTAKEKFFDCFEVYLNEELDNGDIIPIYSSSDEEVKRLLIDFDSTFINYDLAKASKMYLNELIEYIVMKVKNNVKLNKNQIEIHYIDIECPKWFESGISYQDIKFTPFGTYNPQNFTTDICFIINSIIDKGGPCVTYWIVFSDFDFTTSIYETKYEFHTYITQTLNNTYGAGNTAIGPYINLSNNITFNTAPLPQVYCDPTAVKEINSFPSYVGGLYKPLIIPVDDEVIISDEDIKSIEESAKQVLKQIDEENENE